MSEPRYLANMRSLGVQAVAVTCDCGHHSLVDVSALPGSMTVPLVQERLRCTSCGQRPIDTRPNWLEYRAQGGG